jgi:hypothetical protein
MGGGLTVVQPTKANSSALKQGWRQRKDDAAGVKEGDLGMVRKLW